MVIHNRLLCGSGKQGLTVTHTLDAAYIHGKGKGVFGTLHKLGAGKTFPAGQELQLLGNGTVQHKLGLLPHLLQKQRHGQRAAQGIPVGGNMSKQQYAVRRMHGRLQRLYGQIIHHRLHWFHHPPVAPA